MSFKRPGSHSKGAFGVTFNARQDRQQQEQQQQRQPAPARDAPADDPSSSYARNRSGQLPIARVRRELLYLVETHATVILVGETGCGKTTQVGLSRHAC
jgi:ATP-dependent RNA helicase DDX35